MCYAVVNVDFNHRTKPKVRVNASPGGKTITKKVRVQAE